MTEVGNASDCQRASNQKLTPAELRKRFEEYMNDNKGGVIDHPLRYIEDHKLHEFLLPFYEGQGLEDVLTLEELECAAQLAKKGHLLAIGERVGGLTKAEINAIDIQQSKAFWREPKELLLTLGTCCLASMVHGWGQVANGNLGWTDALGVHVDARYHYDKHAVTKFAIVQAIPWLSAAILGSYLSDPLSEFTGRRVALFVAALCSFSSAIAGSRVNTWQGLVGTRVVMGLGMGGKAAIVPILESEIVPSSKRGRLLVSWQMFTAAGIFFGSIACYIFRDHWRNQILSTAIPAFALMLATFACCESPRWLIVRGKYKQAYSTLLRLRTEPRLAAKELVSIHYQIQVERALFLRRYADEEAKIVPKSWPPEVPRTSWWERFECMIYVSRNYRASISAAIVMVSQNLSGIGILSFLATQFYTTAGLGHPPLKSNDQSVDTSRNQREDEANSFRFAILFGAVNTLFSSMAYFFVDRKEPNSRKTNSTASKASKRRQGAGRSDARSHEGIAMTDMHESSSNQIGRDMAPVTHEDHPKEANKSSNIHANTHAESRRIHSRRDRILKKFPEYKNAPKFRGRRFLLLTSLGSGVVTLFLTAMMFYIDHSNPARTPMIILFLMIFTAFYSPGAGAIPFLYCAEIFPNEGRELGMSWSTFCNFLGAGLVALVIPFGLHWTDDTNQSLRNLLGLFSGLNAVAFLSVWFCVYATDHTTSLEDYSYVFGKGMWEHMEVQLMRLWKWNHVHAPIFWWPTMDNEDADGEPSESEARQNLETEDGALNGNAQQPEQRTEARDRSAGDDAIEHNR